MLVHPVAWCMSNTRRPKSLIGYLPGLEDCKIRRLALAGITFQQGLGSRTTSEELSKTARSCVGQPSWHANLDLRALACVASASEVCANSLRPLRHPTQSPMTVRYVSTQCDCIEATAIVAAAHSKLTLLIIEFYDHSRRFRVTEGIRQRLSRNAENFVYYVAVENIASSQALHREIN